MPSRKETYRSKAAPSVQSQENNGSGSDQDRKARALIDSTVSQEPERPRQADPSQLGRTVKHKKANSAFLVHQQWKEDQKAKRIAAGIGEEEEEQPIEAPSLRVFVRWTLLAVIAAMAIGHFITGDVLYGYEGKWRNPKRWLPVSIQRPLNRWAQKSTKLVYLSALRVATI